MSNYIYVCEKLVTDFDNNRLVCDKWTLYNPLLSLDQLGLQSVVPFLIVSGALILACAWTWSQINKMVKR